MPYIKQEDRERLSNLIDKMTWDKIEANGDLNYVLYTYCLRHIKPSYNNYKNYIGELRQCATEIERRILGPYEDKKIEENGDIY